MVFPLCTRSEINFHVGAPAELFICAPLRSKRLLMLYPWRLRARPHARPRARQVRLDF